MKKLNNKGFSLVELIIVIAIMVILVAVLSPVFTKYVERGRKSTDVQTASELVTAIQTAAVDPFNTTFSPSGTKEIVDQDFIDSLDCGSMAVPKVKSKNSGNEGANFYVIVNGDTIEIYAGNTTVQIYPDTVTYSGM